MGESVLLNRTAAQIDAIHLKVDGIEAGAEVNPDAAEIKTAYEGNADTNAFTDGEKTKLTNIEENATADMSAGEIKTAYESNANTNAYIDTEKSLVSGYLADPTVMAPTGTVQEIDWANGINQVLDLKAVLSTGAITAFADAGGGEVTVTSAGHGKSNGDVLVITGTTSYNAEYTISGVTEDTYDITAEWVADDATGTWTEYPQDDLVPTFANMDNMVAYTLEVRGGYRVIDWATNIAPVEVDGQAIPEPDETEAALLTITKDRGDRIVILGVKYAQ